MKRILPLALALLAAAALRAADPYQVAVIPKGTTDEYWKSIHAGALQAQRELKAAGIEVVVIWKGPLREDDREQQVQVVENFIGRQVSGIVHTCRPMKFSTTCTCCSRSSSRRGPFQMMATSMPAAFSSRCACSAPAWIDFQYSSVVPLGMTAT
jgi:hypothetical protein